MSRPALVPELYVTDLCRSLRFYLDALGFRLEYQRPEEGFAAISLGGAHLMLEQTRSCAAADDGDFARGEWRTAPLEHPFGRGVNFEITVADVGAVHARLLAQRHPIKLGPQDKWYRVGDRLHGARQLLVVDPDGYLVRLAQTIGWRAAGDPPSR